MKPGEGARDPSELVPIDLSGLAGQALQGQAYVLDIEGQAIDMAPEPDPRGASLIRQAQAIEAEYQGLTS